MSTTTAYVEKSTPRAALCVVCDVLCLVGVGTHQDVAAADHCAVDGEVAAGREAGLVGVVGGVEGELPVIQGAPWPQGDAHHKARALWKVERHW